mmetsp:Transcript_45972/g.98269  ORF Transcript_45972/g.98269 Transcript_45972/m.98269 type:complete len:492 (+) Transcript_45972:40-1515(+)
MESSQFRFGKNRHGYPDITALKDVKYTVTEPGKGKFERYLKEGETRPDYIFFDPDFRHPGEWKFETDAEVCTVTMTAEANKGDRHWADLRVALTEAEEQRRRQVSARDPELVLERMPLQNAEKLAREEVASLSRKIQAAAQEMPGLYDQSNKARKIFEEKDALRRAAEEEARRRQVEALEAAEVLKAIELGRKAAESKHQEFQAALVTARNRLADATAQATRVRGELGVSLEFLASDFVPALEREFPGVDVQAKTFLELAEMLWGPPGPGFAHRTDFLGHASAIDPNDEVAGVSLASAIGMKHPRRVGSTNLFVSWTWQYTVRGLVQALVDYGRRKELCPETTFLWVCFFTNNQRVWRPRAQNGVEVFAANVQRIGRVVCVLDTFDKALYFQRLWTLYEMFVACIVLRLKVDLAIMEDGRAELLVATLVEVARCIKAVNIANASATYQSDAIAIWKEIKSVHGGADLMGAQITKLLNQLVFELLTDLQANC